MARDGMMGSDDLAARVAEWLRDDEPALPRSEFRSALRERLMTAPPVAPRPWAGGGAPVLVGLALLAVGLVLMRTAPWRDLPVERPPAPVASTRAPIVSGGPSRDAGTRTEPSGRTAEGTTRPQATATPSLARFEATVGAAGGGPGTATVAGPTPVVAEPASEVRRSEPDPVSPSPTEMSDAPEHTPRPVFPTVVASATVVPETATTEGGLPATPTAAPTGQGWPTLPAPATPEGDGAGS